MIKIPVSRPRISKNNIKHVVQALTDLNISGHSAGVKDFENRLARYLRVDNVIAVTNGSVALDIAVNSLGIGEGDECIIPTFTIISTVSQLIRQKAKIKLVDADPDTWSIDMSKAIDLVNSTTKLVVPVHIYGLPADMDPLINLKNSYNFKILEDAAEALGVTYRGKKCGSFGDISTFSFYANKQITTGEGGAICTNDSYLAEKIRNLINLNFIPGKRFVSDELGYNARLNNLSAQLGLSQLEEIDDLQAVRDSLAIMYTSKLSDHPWIDLHLAHTNYAKNKYWVYGIKLNKNSPFDAVEFTRMLFEQGIETRRFFCPLHLQPVAKKYNFIIQENFEVSENLWKRGLYLPFGAGITLDEVEIVCNAIWKIHRNYNLSLTQK